MAQPNQQQLAQVAEQLRNEMTELEQQREQLNEYLNELQQTKDAIGVVEDATEDEKVLLPLGSGSFVHARLEDASAVLAPLGGGVLAEEPPAKAVERLESREQEAKQAREQVQQNIQRLQQKLQELASGSMGQQPGQGGQEQPSGPGSAG